MSGCYVIHRPQRFLRDHSGVFSVNGVIRHGIAASDPPTRKLGCEGGSVIFRCSGNAISKWQALCDFLFH